MRLWTRAPLASAQSPQGLFSNAKTLGDLFFHEVHSSTLPVQHLDEDGWSNTKVTTKGYQGRFWIKTKGLLLERPLRGFSHKGLGWEWIWGSDANCEELRIELQGLHWSPHLGWLKIAALEVRTAFLLSAKQLVFILAGQAHSLIWSVQSCLPSMPPSIRKALRFQASRRGRQQRTTI